MAYVKKIWKDYPDTTTPILAEDLNNIENGIEAVDTAINEVNNKFNYSTEEHIVGTWIDGKPIYRKCFTSDTYNTSYSISINNIQTITNIVCMVRRSDYDIWQVLPSRIGNASFTVQFENLVFTNTNLTVNVTWGTSWASALSKINIIVEYTKTTD